MNLTVPAVVQEGDSFFPRVTVSKRVNATFRVYIPVINGTAKDGMAKKDLDYSYANQDVALDITITTNATTSPVRILMDDIVELNETFNIVIQLSHSPTDIEHLVKYNNPTPTVTIIDTKGECTCVFLQFQFIEDLHNLLCDADI